MYCHDGDLVWNYWYSSISRYGASVYTLPYVQSAGSHERYPYTGYYLRPVFHSNLCGGCRPRSAGFCYGIGRGATITGLVRIDLLFTRLRCVGQQLDKLLKGYIQVVLVLIGAVMVPLATFMVTAMQLTGATFLKSGGH